jgi:NAD(P)H-dependent FMN reductase
MVITVVISTNRRNSSTSRIAALVAEEFLQLGHDAQLLDLAELPAQFLNVDMYNQRSESFLALFDTFIVRADHIVFVIPEYNGSYPGVLKLFLDASPVRSFQNKYSSMIGLSDGHAGNLRGQDHLTAVLHYLKVHVHFDKPKLSGITKWLSPEGVLTNENYAEQLKRHAQIVTAPR